MDKKRFEEYKILGIAISISVVFEIIFNYTFAELDLQRSLYSILFHGSILIVSFSLQLL